MLHWEGAHLFFAGLAVCFLGAVHDRVRSRPDDAEFSRTPAVGDAALTIIQGILSFPGSPALRDITGTVRLEDVTLADAPSVSLAAAAFAAGDAEAPIPFRLDVAGPVHAARDYHLTAEAVATEAASGRRRPFGTTAAIPWRPDAPASPVAVPLKPWTA